MARARLPRCRFTRRNSASGSPAARLVRGNRSLRPFLAEGEQHLPESLADFQSVGAGPVVPFLVAFQLQLQSQVVEIEVVGALCLLRRERGFCLRLSSGAPRRAARRGHARSVPSAATPSARQGLPARFAKEGSESGTPLRCSNTKLVTSQVRYFCGNIPSPRAPAPRSLVHRLKRLDLPGVHNAGRASAGIHRSHPGSSPVHWPVAPPPVPPLRHAAA